MVAILLWACTVHPSPANPPPRDWNQWLGGPTRQLTAHLPPNPSAPPPPHFTHLWKRPIGSGYAGISIAGTHAVTAFSDGRRDLLHAFDPATGAERWSTVLSRTRRRGEGVPLGPLSTPAVDAEAAYAQSLDGRFVCADIATGALRWETQLKRTLGAYEPGYGFASSPLLLEDVVVLLPAGSTSASVTALDRRTGAIRWKSRQTTGTEYASATLLDRTPAQILAQLGDKLVGLAPTTGALLWEVAKVQGGLWTPSVLSGSRVLFPTAERIRVLDLAQDKPVEAWTSEVFAGAMGPIVEIHGLLIGHHQRRLTALDVRDGTQRWQLPDETDGQLLVVGQHLVFLHDRLGQLQVLEVGPQGSRVLQTLQVIQPARTETPLSIAGERLFVRTPTELVALRMSRSAP